MKVVIAPDKFKGSLTGIEFCNIVEENILELKPNSEILKLPLADGGDGTIEVANYYLEGEFVEVIVNNPFFKPVKASYLFSENSKTAFIEMAEASGVKLLQKEELNCMEATTFGTGELIIDALEKGVKTIILGIGGSATNDCGIGMAAALGYQFLDKKGNKVIPIGKNLSEITTIDASKNHPFLIDTVFKIACDVTNPLYGKNGAAYVYAAQKGASKDEVKMLDDGLQHIAKLIEQDFKINPQNIEGAGAAGGMGIASKVFLNGELISGINLIKELARFDEHIKNADWIITGEGKLDNQTLSGKVIQGVLESAKKLNIKTAAFCGSVAINEKEISTMGISYIDSVIERALSLEDAMENSANYLNEITAKFVKEELR
ncbi:glycerate kinase [Lutibacter sp. TH_r2]|uniref:glycerate kinase n=1 Tax=Lutibacter sp. TH_r2 TaxID=3082083 RepID=UPI002952970B|nr:glycerate kinase [Lutibacter sp. TH_r2]MDV7187652.1 glycerate kinase [Lutibacter sp. TH_r2]